MVPLPEEDPWPRIPRFAYARVGRLGWRDEGGGVAAKYRVSRAWVHRLVQRRRETGDIGPRRQTKFRARTLAEQEDRLRAW